MLEELSWSWSYGSWIYNYLCNQWPSPLTLWVWIPLVQGVLDRTLRDKVCQWLATGWCVLQHSMTRDHIFNIYSVQLSYSCLELRLDRIWWYSPGCMVGVLMSVGVMTVGVMSVGEIIVRVMTVGVMTVRVMRRPQTNKHYWWWIDFWCLAPLSAIFQL